MADSCNISPEVEEEFREVFNKFDQDDDGFITVQEFECVLNRLGLNPGREVIEQKIKECDADGNGCIDFKEFLSMMAEQRKQPRTSCDLRDAFKIFDKDGNGFISLDELRQVMKSLGENLTDDQLREMLAEADIDGDGQVNFEGRGIHSLCYTFFTNRSGGIEFVKLIEPR